MGGGQSKANHRGGTDMKETMKALEALFKMKDPSIEKILRNFNYYFEANQVKALMDAYEKERTGIPYDEAQSHYEIDAILKEAGSKCKDLRVSQSRFPNHLPGNTVTRTPDLCAVLN
jgi:hypothetical protein